MSGVYNALDFALLSAIALGPSTFTQLRGDTLVCEAVKNLGTAMNEDDFRLIDRRLQALRKRGLIKYSRKDGWTSTVQGEPA